MLDLNGQAAFTEYFVICTGFSTPQMQAICNEVEELLYKEMKRSPEHREGHRSTEWALLDFGGFIVHVFGEQARKFYDLERLWRAAPKLEDAGESERGRKGTLGEGKLTPARNAAPGITWAAGEVRNVKRAIAVDRGRSGVAETLRTRPASGPSSHHDPDQRRERQRKEYLARLIHELGPRRDTPYLKIDCTSLPSGLVEAELFGYERGGFAGAADRKLGAFELGLKGTVVIDEIAALSASAQDRLLCVLQDQKTERIGGSETVPVATRVIALTSADMGSAVKERRFREDLYHRLDMAKIWVAPLRERITDILPLAEFFLAAMRTKHGKPKAKLSDNARRLLQGYRWPGNVQELQTAAERAVITGKGEIPGSGRLPQRTAHQFEQGRARIAPALPGRHRARSHRANTASDGTTDRALCRDSGYQSKTLLEKRKKYGLVPEPSQAEVSGNGSSSPNTLRRGQAG